MKLYICFSTNGGDHHACAKAHSALVEAGYEPELEKVYGSGYLPKIMQTKGRKKLARMKGNFLTPVLVLDDGTVVDHSDNIVKWASANPVNN